MTASNPRILMTGEAPWNLCRKMTDFRRGRGYCETGCGLGFRQPAGKQKRVVNGVLPPAARRSRKNCDNQFPLSEPGPGHVLRTVEASSEKGWGIAP